ncbi:MAG: hypothetical protein Q9227_000010 [Pyrenula ochraceoflavens]
MEIHSVLPGERAHDESGKTLPWGYRYLDSTRNLRTEPEETGPFGRHRTARYTSSMGRNSRGRTGTTPIRKEDPNVAEFGRLLSKQQKEEEKPITPRPDTSPPTTSKNDASTSAPNIPSEKVPTEVLLFGYASKASEWRVISKFERIVSPSGYICEDYARNDPLQPLTSTSTLSSPFSISSPSRTLSKSALRKSRNYQGGAHWIKVTFDSHDSAERAVFYSPQEIEGHLVFAQMWGGRGPFSDQPIPKASHLANDLQRQINPQIRTMTTTQSANYLSAAAETGRSAQTLPRSFTAPDAQYAPPLPSSQDDASISSTTASSATATADQANGLRSRSTPNLTSQSPPNPPWSTDPSRQYTTKLPHVRRAVLRPISEALPPQPSLSERILRNIPIVNWFLGANKAAGGAVIGEGPMVKEVRRKEREGGAEVEALEFDWDANGSYWRFWGTLDWWLGTDFCGVKGE